MNWLTMLPEQTWDRLVDLSNSLATVVVALIVAFLATRRETKKQLAQRHFDFRDERANQYADVLKKANEAFFEFWECYSATALLTIQEIRAANTSATQLETAVQKIQVQAPDFVAHACLNLNGRLQHMVSELRQKQLIDMKAIDYEGSKQNLLKVMKVDLKIIEGTSDRATYQSEIKNENARYFKEIGVEEPNQ